MKQLVIALLLLASGPVSALPVTISFDPAAASVRVGDTFTVDILANIPDAVLGWGLDVSFDTAILALAGPPAVGASWMGLLGFDGDGLAGAALPPVSGGGVVLATLTLRAIGAGSSVLTAGVTAGDLTEGFALASAPPGAFAELAFTGATVTVTATPTVAVPPPLLLIGAGLLTLGRTRSRRA